MERKHSWTWLPTRFNSLPAGESRSSPKRRPPIPCLEQLEDRVLLSAASSGGTDAILIGLLKGEVDLRSSQISFLKTVEGLNTGTQAQSDALWKMTDAFAKIDSAVSALTADALFTAGHKVDSKGEEFLKIKLQDVIISSFAKIDQQLGAFGDGSVDKLLPAVKEIQSNTSEFLTNLSQLPAVQSKDYKELGGFLKIQNELFKVDVILDTAAKFQDFHFTHHTDKASTTLMAKMDTTFNKIDSDIIAVFGDGSVAQAIKGDVDALRVETEGVLIGLLKPAPVGTPTITALTTTPTSDTIG
ncbi:MAG: LEPR-XLL domain-containing protein [Phycisphaerae bacterium]